VINQWQLISTQLVANNLARDQCARFRRTIKSRYLTCRN